MLEPIDTTRPLSLRQQRGNVARLAIEQAFGGTNVVYAMGAIVDVNVLNSGACFSV
jgi:hypothetical protein